MVNEADVRDRLLDVLCGQITLDAFEDWLVEASWNMHQGSTRSAQKLVGSIEVLLAEYSNGHRTEGELRAALGLLASTVMVIVDLSEPANQQIPASRLHATSNSFYLERESRLATA